VDKGKGDGESEDEGADRHDPMIAPQINAQGDRNTGSKEGKEAGGEASGEVLTIFQDPRVAELMADPELDADACVCMSALLALLTSGNQHPYTESWHVPVQVKVFDSGGDARHGERSAQTGVDTGQAALAQSGASGSARRRTRSFSEANKSSKASGIKPPVESARIKDDDVGKGRKKKLLWDKPVLKRQLTVKEKKTKFYKVALKDLCVQHAAKLAAKLGAGAGADVGAGVGAGGRGGEGGGEEAGGVVFSEDFLRAKEVLTAGMCNQRRSGSKKNTTSNTISTADTTANIDTSAAALASAAASAASAPRSAQSRTNFTYDLWQLGGAAGGVRLLVRTKVAAAMVDTTEYTAKEEELAADGDNGGDGDGQCEQRQQQQQCTSTKRRMKRVVFSAKLEHWPVEGPEDVPLSTATKWWMQLYLQGGGRSTITTDITRTSEAGAGVGAAAGAAAGPGAPLGRHGSRTRGCEEEGGDKSGAEGEVRGTAGEVTWIEPCLVIGRVRASDSRLMELQPRTLADVLPPSMSDPLDTRGVGGGSNAGSFDALAKFGLLQEVLSRLLDHPPGPCILAHESGSPSVVIYRTVEQNGTPCQTGGLAGGQTGDQAGDQAAGKGKATSGGKDNTQSGGKDKTPCLKQKAGDRTLPGGMRKLGEGKRKRKSRVKGEGAGEGTGGGKTKGEGEGAGEGGGKSKGGGDGDGDGDGGNGRAGAFSVGQRMVSTTPGGGRKFVGKIFDLHTEHQRYGTTDTATVPFIPLVWRFDERPPCTFPIASYCRSFSRYGQCNALMNGDCIAEVRLYEVIRLSTVCSPQPFVSALASPNADRM
jgi:hypothetical protein